MEEVTAVKVTSGFADLDKLNEIYTEAFPPAERKHTLKQMLESPVIKFDIKTYYCDGNIIGLSVLRNSSAFAYMLFIAVNNAQRSNGYGGKILDKLIDDCGGKPLVFAIEDPKEECDNREQRIKREAFYLRHNCVHTGYKARYIGNVTCFRLMSSRNLDGFLRVKIILRVMTAISSFLWAIWFPFHKLFNPNTSNT